MSVRAKILELMIELKDELDLTYVYITHDLATAKFFCDRIAIMYLGPDRRDRRRPSRSTRTRSTPTRVALLRAIPEPDPTPQRARATCRAARCPTRSSPPLGCSFHPRCPQAFEVCGWESRDLRDAARGRAGRELPEEELRARARADRRPRRARRAGDRGAAAAPAAGTRRGRDGGARGACAPRRPTIRFWKGVAATEVERGRRAGALPRGARAARRSRSTAPSVRVPPARPRGAREGALAAGAARQLGLGDHVGEDLGHLLGLAAVAIAARSISFSAWSCSGGCRVISGLPSAAA